MANLPGRPSRQPTRGDFMTKPPVALPLFPLPVAQLPTVSGRLRVFCEGEMASLVRIRLARSAYLSVLSVSSN